MKLNVDRGDLDALYRGAFLHDIGKIGIADRVLLKKGRLTPAERALMQQHPAVGDDLCSTVRSLDVVRPIVRHHHERIDGGGYPDGLKGGQIPLLAQIVSVVDVFDALTTDRPYRKALSTDVAYQMMRDDAASGWCATALVDAFIDLHQSNQSCGIKPDRAHGSGVAAGANGIRL
jgi:putative two-component system response regulator